MNTNPIKNNPVMRPDFRKAILPEQTMTLFIYVPVKLKMLYKRKHSINSKPVDIGNTHYFQRVSYKTLNIAQSSILKAHESRFQKYRP